MKKIVLEGDRISTQHAYGSNGEQRFLTGAARSLKESLCLAGEEPVEREAAHWPAICLYFKDNRRRDWDNWHKLSMDALRGIVFMNRSTSRTLRRSAEL